MARGVKATPDDAPIALGPAPAHAREVCSECGVHELHPSTTAFTCEHGTWQFDPAAVDEPAEASDEDKRAAALAILGLTEEQYAALTPAE